MKKRTLLIIALNTLLLTLTGCYTYDDGYDNYNRHTDFDGDISNITHFYMSRSVELKIVNENLVNDTLVYQVGDTIKLQLSLDAIFQENPEDSYDLYKTTKSETFETYISKSYHNYYNDFDLGYFNEWIVDLNYLETYPHLKNISPQEILNSQFHQLYSTNRIYATYNPENKKYECLVGIVAQNPTGINSSTGLKKTIHLWSDEYLESSYDYGSEISIFIPLISSLNYKNIVITE